MNTKKITERLYYISEEDAETMTREAAVGREKYINETITEQHGSITDIYVDFPSYYDDKGNLMGDDEPILGHIERKREGERMVRVAVPEVPQEEKSPEELAEEVKDIKKADEKVAEKKKKTKGDKISEQENETLNNFNTKYI